MPPTPIQFFLAGPLRHHSQPRLWASGTSPNASPSRFWMPALRKVPPGCEDVKTKAWTTFWCIRDDDRYRWIQAGRNYKGSCPACFRHSLHILLIFDSWMHSEGFQFKSGCGVASRSPPCSQQRTNKQNASLIPCPYDGKQMWWWVAFHEVLAFVASFLACTMTGFVTWRCTFPWQLPHVVHFHGCCKRGFSCQERDFSLRDHVVALHISWPAAFCVHS